MQNVRKAKDLCRLARNTLEIDSCMIIVAIVLQCGILRVVGVVAGF